MPRYYSNNYRRHALLMKMARDMAASLHTDRPYSGASWERVTELKIQANDYLYPINTKTT